MRETQNNSRLLNLEPGAISKPLFPRRLLAFLRSTPQIADRAKLQRNLGWLVFIRVSILTVLLLARFWADFRGTGSALGQLAYWLIGTTYAISLLNVIALRFSQRLVLVGYCQFVTDVILSSLAIHVTGSLLCFSLYFVVILGAAALFSTHGAVIIAAFAALSYTVISSGLFTALSGGTVKSTAYEILLVYLSLVLVALVSSYLAHQLEIVGGIASRHAKNLSDLTRHQKQLFDDISEGIITVDLNAAITNINQAACAILGLKEYDSSVILGQQLSQVFSTLGIDDVNRMLSSSFAAGASQEIGLDRNVGDNTQHLNCSVRAVIDSEGKESGKLLILNDVSHLRSMEERLQLHERMTQLLAETSPAPSINETANEVAMVGESQVMKQILSLVDRVAASDASVLISGESGTGKELIARAIHLRGARHNKPFVAVNCGAIPESLIESELFGHKKGSFTGAINDTPGLFKQADSGTIFLDEIGELSPQLQTKLLRVLQEQQIRPVGDVRSVPIDVRILAATNKNLKNEIANGGFREDLYYRLNVVNIVIPPLKERREDIPLLVRHFVGRFADPDQVLPSISPEALQILMSYPFPGNIRELENIIERALVLGGKAILLEHLPPEVLSSTRSNTRAPAANPTEFIELPIDLEKLLAGIEKNYLTQALSKTQGVKKQAATLLGLNFRSFRYRLKKYGLGGEDALAEMDDN